MNRLLDHWPYGTRRDIGYLARGEEKNIRDLREALDKGIEAEVS